MLFVKLCHKSATIYSNGMATGGWWAIAPPLLPKDVSRDSFKTDEKRRGGGVMGLFLYRQCQA